jgi:thiamine-phosphate pyrophosphorylase
VEEHRGHDITEFAQEPRECCALYLISPPTIADLDSFKAELEAALSGGPIGVFQLRLKDAADDVVIQTAKALKPILDAHDVALIINDRADIAKAVDADGVHLGQSDGAVKDARNLLGFDRAIGVTCHASRHLAMTAGEQGADYVAFGAFYPSKTKLPSDMAKPEILTWWTALSELPCVAIGGITVDNCRSIIEAGADMLAVSAGVWAYEGGPKAAVARFNEMIEEVEAAKHKRVHQN